MPGGLYDLGTSFHQCLSLTGHALFLIAAALSAPSLHATEDDARTEEAIHMIHEALSAEAEVDLAPHLDIAYRDANDRERVDSKCGAEDGGTSGDRTRPKAQGRYGVRGPADNPDPHVSREQNEALGSPYFPGLPSLRTSWGGDANAPTAPWGRDDSLGNDAASARAGMWGDEIAASLGSPGVGIGRRRLCETCGDSGRGVEREVDFTAGGGATDTESTLGARIEAARRTWIR